MQQFFDHFALANKTIQERLGTAPNSLNRLSALYGMQARGLLQMLSYGDDMITARAASHLLNMDIFKANDAYLFKLGEGLLLNSIESITPPLLHSGNRFTFRSPRNYALYDSVGSITMRDGSLANLLIYDIGTPEFISGGDIEYSVLYCAGQYILQDFSTEDIDLTPGTFQSIYVPETYKSIWTPSVRIRLEGINMPVIPVYSMPELLAYPDRDRLVLCQHTGRGMTITLGDGEAYGAGYNNPGTFANITGVSVSYIKTDSLSEADNSTIQFNGDIDIPYPDRIPVLDKPSTGDTAETFRSRAVAEMFASGKITDEKDLVTEIKKIPIVRSCSAYREQNRHFPVAPFNMGAYNEGRPIIYPHGSMCEFNGALYVVLKKDKGTETLPPDNPESSWQVIVPADIYSGLLTMGLNAESAFRYDNATIVLSGLMVANRRYWSPDHSYIPGDVVYYRGTNELYSATDNIRGIEPGTDVSPDMGYERNPWVSQKDAAIDPAYSAYRIEDYVPITQAAYELELKGYFGIASKLGFTSVVVEPCASIPVYVSCSYEGAHVNKEEVTRFIQEYVCYNVGKNLLASELHSLLTETFGLSKVYVNVNGGDGLALASREYVARGDLTISLKDVAYGK